MQASQTTTDTKTLFATWEKAASAWFDAWARSPAYLSAAGKMLQAQLGMKTTVDGWIADALEAWKIPTARDLRAMGERIAALEERIAELEADRAPGAAPKGEGR